MRDYMRGRYHLKRKEIIKLLGGKCCRCGKGGKLVIDHKDRKKKTMRSADVHSTNDATVQKELKNLQLLCPECDHKKSLESWDYNAPKPRHGTYWMYRKHKCRCDKCVKAYQEKGKEWRQPGKGPQKSAPKKS